jgi:transcription elongation factor Elf1
MNRGDGVETCIACGSDSLFDCDTEPGREGDFVLVCNDCGQQQDRPIKSRETQ